MKRLLLSLIIAGMLPFSAQALTLDDVDEGSANKHLTGALKSKLQELPAGNEFGSCAFLNVAESGDATTGQAVKWDDTRLSDARNPLSHGHNAADISEGNISNAEFDRLNGVTGNIQSQLDGKQPLIAVCGTFDILRGDGSCTALPTLDQLSEGTANKHFTAAEKTKLAGLSGAAPAALATNGTNCSSGEYARGVDASGNAENCTAAPSVPIPVLGATSKPAAFPIFKSATVASGNAVFHLTNNEASGGTALCPNSNVHLDSLLLRADNEVDTPFSYGQPTLSNSNKTITIAVKKAANVTTLPIIGTLTGALLGAPVAANGAVVKATVWCD